MFDRKTEDCRVKLSKKWNLRRNGRKFAPLSFKLQDARKTNNSLFVYRLFAYIRLGISCVMLDQFPWEYYNTNTLINGRAKTVQPHPSAVAKAAGDNFITAEFSNFVRNGVGANGISKINSGDK